MSSNINLKTNKLNRKPNRLRGYDYDRPGYYYVTICTFDRKEWFGEVQSGAMILNDLGQNIFDIWKHIPNYYANIKSDAHIVMPNHIHGIIIIEEYTPIDVGTEQCSVPTKPIAKLSTQRNSRNYGQLSQVIKSFKDISTKSIRKEFHHLDFRWQRSFYDHIIRDDKDLDAIRHYITNNALKWEYDKNNPKNWPN